MDWKVVRQLLIPYFFLSYLILILSSMLLAQYRAAVLLLDSIWLFAVFARLLQAKKSGSSFWHALTAVLILQVPGLLAAAVSLIAFFSKEPDPVADGFLEFWIHPFLPVLESLPTLYHGELSDLFVKSCLLPFAIPLLLLLAWLLPHRKAAGKG